MSSKKKTEVTTGTSTDLNAPEAKPAGGKGSRGPRKPKVEGPASRAVEKDGTVVALVLNSLSDQAAVECVTGKFTARIVGISEGIILARQQDLPVHDQAAMQ